MKHTPLIIMLAATLLFCSCEAKQKENAREKAVAEKYVAFGYEISGLNVNFTDSTSGVGGGVTSRMWDFGDGVVTETGDTRQGKYDPSVPLKHTYVTTGSYNVTLTITWIADICGKPEDLTKTCTKVITLE